MIFAQAVPAAPMFGDWERLLMIGGPLYAMFAVFLYFIVWYGPGMIQAHRDMMVSMAESGKKSALASEQTALYVKALGDSVGQLQGDTRRIRRALSHGAAAGEMLTGEHIDAQKEMRRAKDIAHGFTDPDEGS